MLFWPPDKSYHPSRAAIPGALYRVLRVSQYVPRRLLAPGADARHDDPPPPYPHSESGETTQPVNPGSDDRHAPDNRYEWIKQTPHNATPYNQFRSQVSREKDRLTLQRHQERSGRRQTLPYDDSSDLLANAYNNVRKRWREQGIWADEWGPAFPEDCHPRPGLGTLAEDAREDGPFSGHYDPARFKSKLGARWGHETTRPESESESEPGPEPEEVPFYNMFGYNTAEAKRWERHRQRLIKDINRKCGPVPQLTVRNLEASRPCKQFVYQVARERERIKDEMEYERPSVPIDVDFDDMASQSVRNKWIDDGIWNPRWGDKPDLAWMYEHGEEQGPVEATPFVFAAREQPPRNVIDDSHRQTRDQPLASPPSLFGPAPTQGVGTGTGSTDDSSSPASGGVEPPVTETLTAGGTRESPTRRPAATHRAQDSQDGPQQSLQVESTSQEGQGVPCRTCQSKRSRSSDEADDEQPSKRQRPTDRDSEASHNASDAGDAGQLRTPPSEGEAASTTGAAAGQRKKSAPSPLRRSARITVREREGERTTYGVEQLPTRSPRTKSAKESQSTAW